MCLFNYLFYSFFSCISSHLYYLPSLILYSFVVWVASKPEWLEEKREWKRTLAHSQTRLNKLIKSVFYSTPCLFICVPPEQLTLHTPKTRLNLWTSLFRGTRCASAWRGFLMITDHKELDCSWPHKSEAAAILVGYSLVFPYILLN